MTFNLTNNELALIIVSMATMRKNIKKGFKKNYGRKDGKVAIDLYDQVKEKFENVYEEMKNDNENIELNDEETNMLHSFLSWYTTELEVELDNNTNIRLDQIKDEINSLKAINERLIANDNNRKNIS